MMGDGKRCRCNRGYMMGDGKRCRCNQGSSMMSSETTIGIVEGISLSISFSISLSLDMVISSHRGGITQSVHNFLTDFFIFNLLCSISLHGTNLLSCGGANLCSQDDFFCDTVRGRASMIGKGGNWSRNGVACTQSKIIGISISIRLGSSVGQSQQAGEDESLSVHVKLDYFPRRFEL